MHKFYGGDVDQVLAAVIVNAKGATVLGSSQHPPTHWNLRGGRWSIVEFSIYCKNVSQTDCTHTEVYFNFVIYITQKLISVLCMSFDLSMLLHKKWDSKVPVQLHCFRQCCGFGSGSVRPPGSGFGSGPFHHPAKTVKKTLVSTVLLHLFDFLCLKTDEMYLQNVIRKKT